MPADARKHRVKGYQDPSQMHLQCMNDSWCVNEWMNQSQPRRPAALFVAPPLAERRELRPTNRANTLNSYFLVDSTRSSCPTRVFIGIVLACNMSRNGAPNYSSLQCAENVFPRGISLLPDAVWVVHQLAIFSARTQKIAELFHKQL